MKDNKLKEPVKQEYVLEERGEKIILENPGDLERNHKISKLCGQECGVYLE